MIYYHMFHSLSKKLMKTSAVFSIPLDLWVIIFAV